MEGVNIRGRSKCEREGENIKGKERTSKGRREHPREGENIQGKERH
jgi:hypothetical protein